MKSRSIRFFSLFLAILLVVAALPATALAAETADVFVTVSVAGEIKQAQYPVNVVDLNGNGDIDIDDALHAFHTACYPGGADAGYCSAATDYGLSITRLWGDESGAFGYYVNDTSAWSLMDLVTDGDYITAFVYADTDSWSDQYAFFSSNTAAAAIGEPIRLTLHAYAYDAAWNLVDTPVAGASVTVSGSAAVYTTDKNGAVTISFPNAGSYTVTATAEGQVLVPPVCCVTVDTFNDLSDVWAADYIRDAAAKGLLLGNGYSFDPYGGLNRAMLVTVLWRLAGTPAVSSEQTFRDVAENDYCFTAVNWAYENGLALGYGDGSFGPFDSVSRQDAAVLLSRYAKLTGLEVSSAANLAGYSDASAISSYALSSVSWAVSNGILSGRTDGTIDPIGTLNRAECAKMISIAAKLV